MNERQKENEQKIFKVIQELKDSVFGLRQPYIGFCYVRSRDDGFCFVPEKAEHFAEELSCCAKKTLPYREELAEVMPLFYRTIVRLLHAICGSGDWVFVSFRKLAETALKSEPEERSVLERIVDDHRRVIDRTFPGGTFWPDYDAFCSYMGRVDAEAFYRCAKQGVEAFVDEHQLNVLDRDQLTEAAVARISRLAAAIDRDLVRPEVPWEDEE